MTERRKRITDNQCTITFTLLPVEGTIGCTLKVEQPLRLFLNLFFYQFSHYEPAYKSQHINFLDVIVACNQLNLCECSKLDIVNDLTEFICFGAVYEHVEGHLIFGEISHIPYLIKTKFLIVGN